MSSSERIYRRLLICLPPAFRAEATDELIDTFRRAHARLAGRGLVAGLMFWGRMLADLAVTSGAERFQRTRHQRVLIRPRDLMAFFNDFRIAARVLRHQPGFALTAVLTLALGIGAITAIYSVVHAVLLQPLPYREPGRLVLVWQELRARQVPEFPFPPGDLPDLRQQGTLFEGFAGLSTGRQTLLSATDQPEQVRSAFVTTNTLGLLGLRIALGRDFEDSDGTPPPPQPVAGSLPAGPPPPPFMTILSHEYWMRRYGGDPNVIGQTIQAPGNATGHIVGVLAPEAQLLFAPRNNVEKSPELWVASRTDFSQSTRTQGVLRVIGRLKPNVTVAQAQQQMDKLASDLRETYQVKKNAGVYINVVPMHESLVADVRLSILALMGAVVFVLLIACANVANLLMTQAARRERELAVKTALGAGRTALVRQLLAESLLLALAGSLIGLGLARAGIAALQRIGPQDLPRLAGVSIDLPVLAFSIGAALGSVLLFGLLPAIRASRSTIVDVLRQSGRTAGLGSGRLRSGLVIVEVALSFVLLVGAGLMLRSLVALTHVDPGYDPNGVLTFLVSNIRGNTLEARAEFTRRMREEIGRLPDVRGASAATPVPLDGRIANIPWGTEAAASDPAAFRQAVSYVVAPGFFEAMHSPAIDGRTFTENDNNPDLRLVMIDHLLAARAFPGESAVGKRLLLRLQGNAPTPHEVIGVVRHQRHESLAADGREGIYFLDAQRGFGTANRWVVRTSRDPMQLAESVKQTIARLDPGVIVTDVQPMSFYVDRAQAPTRFALTLTTAFAMVAAVLAVIGLYGVLSTLVRQRTAEIGVRLAFGAQRASIFKLIVGRGLILAAIGLVIGVGASLGMTRTISSLLVGVRATDPATFVATGIVFLMVAAVACGLPAYRASRLDANVALRNE